jgi:hypothetical protein
MLEDVVVILERGAETDVITTEYQVAVDLGPELFTTEPVKDREYAEDLRDRCIESLKEKIDD